MADVVLLEKKNRVGYVTINRPERRNAISRDVVTQMLGAFAELQADDDILVAILTGAGDKAFCAGGDLVERAEAAKRGEDTRPTLEAMHESDLSLALRHPHFSKPTIAAVNGYAAGGGFGLALMCDIRLSSENAQFGASEVRWSHMAGAAYMLSRCVPLGWAFKMCYSGQFIDAQTAYNIGLTQGLYPQGELLDQATQLAETVAANGDAVILGTRDFLYKSMDVPLSMARALGELYYERIARHPNYVEGTLAFAEKRSPRFNEDARMEDS